MAEQIKITAPDKLYMRSFDFAFPIRDALRHELSWMRTKRNIEESERKHIPRKHGWVFAL